MEETTATTERQPFLSEGWFDPLETAVRGRIRGFIEEMLEAELESALRPTEQRTERPSHPPGVGAGEIGSGDQRLGPLGEPPVGRDRLVAPLRRPAIRPGKTRPRDR